MEIATDFHQKLTEENMPHIPGLDIYARTEPALEIGGDYLGFHKVNDSQVWFMICDAMGKGVSAGFFSVLCHMTFQSILFIHDGMTPGQLLTFTNKIMEKDFDKFGMFMTSLVGRIDLAKNSISYASAGHSQPIIFSEEEGAELLDTPDFMMGVDSHLAYTTVTMPFTKGMKFLCYTDGITDITDSNGEMVGAEPLLHTCSSQFARKGIVQSCEGIFSDAMTALGPNLQDDITMIGIESV
jgi:phosphoserine phosphatase RsbU/P